MEKEIIIENDLSEVISVTRFIESIGISLFLNSNTIRCISLAIEEAVTCILDNAYPNGEKGNIKIRASVINGDFTCMIINDGISFDPTLPLDTSNNASFSSLLTGGLGFYIIFRTMDEVAYHTNGNQNYLMLTKKIGNSDEPESSLNTNICKTAGVYIVTIEGRLDTANSRKFESDIAPLREFKNAKILLNCEKLTYISSSGLRSFILLQKKINSQEGQLILINILPEIHRIFDMTGCTSIFSIH